MTKSELLQTTKPILFNTDMVQAILDNRKTVTRRVVKYPPHPDMPDNHNYCRMPLWMRIGKGECGFRTLHYMDVIEQNPFRQARYFESFAPFDKKDILYVRKTWAKNVFGGYFYRADGEFEVFSWKPSIHMPKEAARLFLKVTDVRVERLQDMDKMDAVKEGINTRCCVNLAHALTKFKKLWNSTIKKQDLDLYGWDANPWVWVIEFERIL